MPIYEYECSHCRYYLEVIQKLSDARLKKCPSCGKNTLKKLISAPVFRLKGSGWYETDFKGDSEQKRNLAGGDKDVKEAKEATDGKDAKAGAAETAGAAATGTEAKAGAASEAKSDSAAESKVAAKGESKVAAPAKASGRRSRPAKKAKPKPSTKSVKRRGRR